MIKYQKKRSSEFKAKIPQQILFNFNNFLWLQDFKEQNKLRNNSEAINKLIVIYNKILEEMETQEKDNTEIQERLKEAQEFKDAYKKQLKMQGIEKKEKVGKEKK